MILDAEAFDGILVDLDGVVTDTAGLHAAAWKRLFDEVLAMKAAEEGLNLEPFDADRDYRTFVDGKPRMEGLKAFLTSRGLTFPVGSAGDLPEAETLGGFSARKNRYFHDLIAREGVPIYETTVAFLRHAKEKGLKIALVSSSKNCSAVLTAAGLEALFDLQVDGNDLETLGLHGKPEPDAYRTAAERLQVVPRRAMVIEDAVAGILAGKAGGFARVIGIDRGGQREALCQAGADIVVEDLAAISLTHDDRATEKGVPPHAFERFGDIAEAAKHRRPVLFLDYDGTLTPIVARPELAVLSEEMRRALQAQARVSTVAIVSGRERENVEGLVKLPELYYAGSHGFDISGPEGRHIQHQVGARYISALAQAERELREGASSIKGALIEGKRFAVAAHYRLVESADLPAFHELVTKVAVRHPELRVTGGKKVLELRPGIDWNKGKAVLWLLNALKLTSDDNLPIYIGDDVTDEDAFEVLRGDGISILVSETVHPTAATYHLRDPHEVRCFLERLTALLQE
jgi:alpha,alpha-trehalase